MQYKNEFQSEGAETKKKESREALFEQLEKTISAKKNADEVKKIIQKFNDNKYVYTSTRYSYDENALHVAARIGSANAAEYLLTVGFDPLTKNVNGNSAYHLAAYANNLNVLKILLHKKPTNDITALLSNYNQTILHSSLCKAGAGNHCFKFLIEKYKTNKNFIDAIDNYGKTALHTAVEKKNTDAARLLLENGADKSIECNAGETAFDIAKKNNLSDILELLTNLTYPTPAASNPLPQFISHSMPVQTQQTQTMMTNQFQALNSFKSSSNAPLPFNMFTPSFQYLPIPTPLYNVQTSSPSVTPTVSKNDKSKDSEKKKRHSDLRALQKYCIEESEKQVAELKSNIDEQFTEVKSNINKQFSQIIPALNHKLEEFSNSASEKQAMNIAFEKNISTLKEDMGKARNSFNQISADMKVQTKRSDSLEANIKSLEKHRDSQSNTITQLQATITAISKRNEELEKDRIALNNTLDSFKRMLEEQSKRIESLEKKQSLQSDVSNSEKVSSPTIPTAKPETDRQTVKRISETLPNAINPEATQIKKQKVEGAPAILSQKPSELSVMKSVFKKK